MGTHFYRRSSYNPETQAQIWSTIVTDSHDAFCSCCNPLPHLLDYLIPEDHKYRHLTIDQLIKQQYKETCLSGGPEETKDGMAIGTDGAEEEDLDIKEKEDLTDEQIEELIAATDAAEESTR